MRLRSLCSGPTDPALPPGGNLRMLRSPEHEDGRSISWKARVPHYILHEVARAVLVRAPAGHGRRSASQKLWKHGDRAPDPQHPPQRTLTATEPIADDRAHPGARAGRRPGPDRAAVQRGRLASPARCGLRSGWRPAVRGRVTALAPSRRHICAAPGRRRLSATSGCRQA